MCCRCLHTDSEDYGYVDDDDDKNNDDASDYNDENYYHDDDNGDDTADYGYDDDDNDYRNRIQCLLRPGKGARYCDERGCSSVSPHAYLENRMAELHQIFCAR